MLTGVTNANGESISYSYNSGYQLRKISIDGKDIEYGYDTMGRLVSVTDSEGTTNYTYDANGNRASTTYPNGVVTTYEYNSINALVRQESKDSNNTVLASYEYTIGANGERLSCTELNRTVEYSYDELNRLTSETITRGSTTSVTEYTYDANSNRTSMTKDGTVTNYTYNSLNQLTQAGNVTYTWDNAGNLVSQSSTGTTLSTYSYDSRNRMTAANVNSLQGTITETYTYDYLGNRTSKTTNGVTTEFTTDLSTGLSQVLKAETGTETVYYTRGFELISRRVGTTASYYLYDGGLSVRGLADENGTITDALVFDAFGNETERTGTTDTNYGFQGEEQDATGLYYLRARYMDPSTGTFTSMDTYAGSISDPTSLHKYLFANANPIKYCDPSGKSTSLTEMDSVVAIITIFAEVSSAIIYDMIGSIFGVDKTHPSYWIGMFAAMILSDFLAYWVAGAFVGGATLCALGKVLLGLMGLITGDICYDFSNTARVNGHDIFADLFELASVLLQTYALYEIIDGIRGGFSSIKDKYTNSGSSNKKGYVRIGGWNDSDNKQVSGANNTGLDNGLTPTSQNQMQRQVDRGQAPRSVDRVDPPHVGGQQPHIHFGQNNAALNMDGTWHDAGKKSIPQLDNKTKNWISDNGWKLPQ